jgi:hypothetical protein
MFDLIGTLFCSLLITGLFLLSIWLFDMAMTKLLRVLGVYCFIIKCLWYRKNIEGWLKSHSRGRQS